MLLGSALISTSTPSSPLMVTGQVTLVEASAEAAPEAPAETRGAALLRHCAATYRLEERRAAERASAKLAVALVLPLGLCSLPAFICCGIIPIVISLLPGLLA